MNLAGNLDKQEGPPPDYATVIIETSRHSLHPTESERSYGRFVTKMFFVKQSKYYKRIFFFIPVLAQLLFRQYLLVSLVQISLNYNRKKMGIGGTMIFMFSPVNQWRQQHFLVNTTPDFPHRQSTEVWIRPSKTHLYTTLRFSPGILGFLRIHKTILGQIEEWPFRKINLQRVTT